MYSLILKHNFAIDQFKVFLSHLCFENKEFSIRIAKFILKGTIKLHYDDNNSYLELLRQYLLIDDSLKNQRLEWIFGIPYFQLKQPGQYSS